MHFASMSLGIFDFLISWLTSFIIWVVGWVFDLIQMLFAELFYTVGVNILRITDMVQLAFKKLAGLDTYWYQEGAKSAAVEISGDPLIRLLTNETIMQVFLSLSIVAVVMVIVASIIQVIRTEFTTEGSKNSKGTIAASAIKALVMFFLVPVCCLGGIIVSNALLKAVDSATSQSGSTSTIGSQIFASAAYDANRVRGTGFNALGIALKNVGFNGTVNENNREQVAIMVDNAFRDNKVGGLETSDVFMTSPYQVLAVVIIYYNIHGMNFITLIGAAILATYTMVTVVFGMIMRLYKVAVLFVISPPLIGLMPLDNGGAYKEWRKAFLKNILSAYGTVVGLNLLFLLLPLVNNIKLFEPNILGSGLNNFMQILFTLTGLFMLKDITGMIANLIGADDASAQGAGMAKKVVGTAAKVGSLAVGGVGSIATKGLAARAAAKGNMGAAVKFSGLSSKMGQKFKGNMGGVLNSGLKSFGLEGGFSTETDVMKAQESKEKRKDSKEKFKEYTANKLYSTEEGKVGFKKDAEGHDKRLADITKEQTDLDKKFNNKEITQKKYDAEKNKLEKRTEQENSRYSDNLFVKEQVAKQKAAEAVQKQNSDVAGLNDIYVNVGKALDTGNGLAASEGLSEMIGILQEIADKTEDQKDLLARLTIQKSQVDSAGGSASALADIKKQATVGIPGVTDGLHIDALAAKVSNDPTTTALSKIDVSATANINTTVKDSGTDIANKLAEKLKSDLASSHTTDEINVALQKFNKSIQEKLTEMQDKLNKDKK